MFHWFWAWDDEKEEVWLREMARKGWHFQSVSLPGNYVFGHGEPRNDVYRLDYFTDAKDKVNYLQIFMDAGWAYVGEMNGWQYFRKTAADGELPEIFSDNESKSKKYQRILLILVVLLPIFINNLNLMRRAPDPWMQILTFVTFLLLLFYIFGIVNLIRRVSQLKKKV
jgi:hypothetical protein